MPREESVTGRRAFLRRRKVAGSASFARSIPADAAGDVWDGPQSLDHALILKVSEEEKADDTVHCLIFKGSKALDDPHVVELLHVLV